MCTVRLTIIRPYNMKATKKNLENIFNELVSILVLVPIKSGSCPGSSTTKISFTRSSNLDTDPTIKVETTSTHQFVF